jgi:hypothetical protein
MAYIEISDEGKIVNYTESPYVNGLSPFVGFNPQTGEYDSLKHFATYKGEHFGIGRKGTFFHF